MKTRLILLVLFFCINSFSQTVVSPQFSELKGMEDQQGNTHLFYRLYSFHKGGGLIGDYHENSIYHLDLKNGIDTLFLYDGGVFGAGITNIVELEFWNNDPSAFIYVGETISVDPEAFIKRFDQTEPSYSELGEAFGVEIGKQNDSLIIATAAGLIKSTDGGINWTPFLAEYSSIISITPYSDSEMFFSNGDRELLKTTDGGQGFSIVDTNHNEPKLFYDKDLNHIYSLAYNKLKVSDNQGNVFSWVERYSSSKPVYLSVDYFQSGSIYLADGKNIYHSTDYGENLNFYRKLDRDIVGIYEKPNSDKLYAATKYKIYEITTDTTKIIKSLPIPDEVFSWFPLEMGNKWIYDHYENIEYYHDKWKTTREVVENKIIDNKVYTKVLVSEYHDDNQVPESTRTKYFRVDSSSGLIYDVFIENNIVNHEEIYMDLLAEINDTIPMGNGIRFTSEIPYSLFDVETYRREFEYVLTPYQIIDLVNGFGLEYEIWWEIGAEGIDSLQGSIIDGIVYGDTSLVTSVDNPYLNVYSYKLEQNFPNPFNPTTKISWQSPISSWQTLKVFDILGNEIATLVNEYKPAGEYEVEFDATGLASGIYFYTLTAGSFTATKKLLLLR